MRAVDQPCPNLPNENPPRADKAFVDQLYDGNEVPHWMPWIDPKILVDPRVDPIPKHPILIGPPFNPKGPNKKTKKEMLLHFDAATQWTYRRSGENEKPLVGRVPVENALCVVLRQWGRQVPPKEVSRDNDRRLLPI